MSSSSNNEVILYDLARRGPPGSNTSWSANVWKTRLLLNYKSIPYRTGWLDHNTIAPTLKKLGVPPNTSGQGSAYTVPTVRLRDGSFVMDSGAIAKVLEEIYPEPKLAFDQASQGRVEKAVGVVGGALVPVFMPRVARDVVVESSAPYLREIRSKRFGMSLEELEASRGGEQAWQAAKPGFEELKKVLEEEKRDEGPFILGSEVSYGDFIIVALVEGFKRIGEDIGERILGMDERFRKLYEGCGKWMERDT